MQHFLYRIKIFLRAKTSIFWALLFPVFLGLLFYFMFDNLGQVEQFSCVKVGVIQSDEDASWENFLTILNELEAEDGVKMFTVTEYPDENAAELALEKKEIEGYVRLENPLHMTVAESNSVFWTSMNKIKR